MRSRTRECRKHGHPEICFTYDDKVVPEPDVIWLIDYLEQAVASGRRLSEGQTIKIGWSVNLIAENQWGDLELMEPDWSGTIPIVFAPGMTRTLSDLRQQKDVVESLAVNRPPSFASIRGSAVACVRVLSDRCYVMDRLEATGSDSGWFFGCGRRDHDHNDPLQLRTASLYEIAATLPEVVQWCALPAGHSVLIGEDQGFKVLANGLAVPVRPDSYLAALTSREEGEEVPEESGE